MKKIYLIALTVVFVLTGCNDFLDSTNYTGKDSENFPSSEQDVNQMVAAVYAASFNSPLTGNDVSAYFYLANLAADDQLGGGSESTDKSTTALDFMMYNKDTDGEAQWNACYSAIARANSALASVDNVADETLRNQTKGELQVLRAYNYFTLAQMFGNVPMVEAAPDNIDEANIAPEQVDAKEVYKKIASDLYNAAEIMPSYKYGSSNLSYGHVTRWAAEALLARVWLFYTGFYEQSSLPTDEADGVPAEITKAMVIAKLEDCIENSGHDLLPDFRSLWAYSNKFTKYSEVTSAKDITCATGCPNNWNDNNAENIMAIAFTYLSAWSSTQLHLTNQYALFCGIRAGNWQDDEKYNKDGKGSVYPFGTGWGAGPVSASLVNDWKAAEPNDPRREYSILTKPDDYDYTNEGEQMQLTPYHQKKVCAVRSGGGEVGEGKTGYYTFGAQQFGSGETGHFQASHPQDLILIRFADVLLMHSELTETADGMNRVRARVGLPAVTYSETALRNERRWELAFEALRWGDIRRWHIAPECLDKQLGQTIYNNNSATPTTNTAQGGGYSARYNATNGFFRIPQTQIDLSAGAYKQNAGWEGTSGRYNGWQ